MKLHKQVLALFIIESGKYKQENGEVYSLRSGVWKLMRCSSLPTGYYQTIISNHLRGADKLTIRIYKHILIYILANGIYPEGSEIDHKDRDKNNNTVDNLRCVSNVVNANNRSARTTGGYCDRPIRGKEIDNIRTLLRGGYNQSEIARMLDLNRLSVRYTIKNMEEGRVLKYEGVY